MFSTDSPQSIPSTCPRKGESIMAATLRHGDALAGSGLSEADRQALAAVDHDDTRRALRECAQRVADLLVERRANAATIHQLQDSLVDANQLIASLERELATLRPCFAGAEIR